MTIERPGLTFHASLEWALDQLLRQARMYPDNVGALFDGFLNELASKYPDTHMDIDYDQRVLTLHCRKWTTTRRF